VEFNSFTFFGFLAFVLALHYTLPRPARRWLLLAASYWFYGAYDWRLLFLIAASTTFDWWFALRIAAAAEPRIRRRWLIASLTSNLSILAFFKYSNFLIASGCALLGADPARWLLKVVLPPGVSFFTFQSMSYTIDVYRGTVPARRSLIDFATFVAFFPQLVAGPIIKANEFFPRFDDWRRPADADLQRAAMLVLVGLLQKVALADNLAPVVEAYFGGSDHSGFLPAVTGALAFGLQIFFDFAGYSNIAIGTALLLGYRFPRNFARPYLAGNVAEFWRRWHISLSTWLRDYLYIPLGGNRGGTWRTQKNLMLTMLLGGLWHGASWNYVVWGGLHGLYLAVHRGWRAAVLPRLPAAVSGNAAWRAACWLTTLAAVLFAWIFFRCVRFDVGLAVARQWLWPDRLGDSVLSPAWLGVIAAVFALSIAEERWALFERLDRAHWSVRGAVFALVLFLITVYAATDAHVQFLYFRF
jgi:D-alanyl-lipoteichoic acid acyltransferase DltB (MBOAT superfamily)